jgi:tripartite-type tricarboxylate transporter receptor subunit TctC
MIADRSRPLGAWVCRARRLVVGLVVLLPLAVAPVSAAHASQVKFIVGFAAGSGIDVILRVVAERVRVLTGDTVIVENRPGAGGRIAAESVARAAADGSVILCAPIVTTAFTPFVFKSLKFDPLKDLVPITRLGNFKFALAVNPELPVNDVREFVAYVKAHPGTVNYASIGAGTPSHFLGVMFNRATGTDLVHVPYNGSGPAAVAVISGQVQSSFNTTAAMLSLYKAKKVKLLAVTGASRAPTLPDVPTFGELKMNLGEIEKAEMWYGFFTPGGTPPQVVQALNATLVKALQDKAVRDQLQTLDIAVATDTPEGFAKLVKDDYDRWGAVIRSTGFTIGQ